MDIMSFVLGVGVGAGLVVAGVAGVSYLIALAQEYRKYKPPE